MSSNKTRLVKNLNLYSLSEAMIKYLLDNPKVLDGTLSKVDTKFIFD